MAKGPPSPWGCCGGRWDLLCGGGGSQDAVALQSELVALAETARSLRREKEKTRRPRDVGGETAPAGQGAGMGRTKRMLAAE